MERARAARWLVALGRRFRPQLRFLWDRRHPGRPFGLEFTSLMAMLAVALFVLVGYTVIVGGDAGPTPGDSPRSTSSTRLRTAWLIDVAKVVTALGSAAVVWPLAAVCAGVARRAPALGRARRARRRDGDHPARRPRDQGRGRPSRGPPAGWSTAPGSSFPSGHAAYSTFYVWLAVTVVDAPAARDGARAPLIAAGIALTALIGLTRVYLGVHYLSDVNAGWALGASGLLALRGGGAGHRHVAPECGSDAAGSRAVGAAEDRN